MHDQSFQRWKMRANLRPARFARGFTIIEIVAAAAVTAIMAASLMLGLLAARKTVASARAVNSARMILQRNIEQALGVPLLSNVNPKPPVLQITVADGENYNNEGVGDTADSIPILHGSTGSILLSGTLTRIVTKEVIPDVTALTDVGTTHLLRVTFRIEYEYLGRNVSQELSTIRAQDDQ